MTYVDHRKIVLAALFATILAIGAYGALGQEVNGTHAITGRGETSCLKCHYGKYEEMVGSGHGQKLVEDIAKQSTALAAQPETYACISCHGKRDRWESFGMADWYPFYENTSANAYAGEWWSLGYKQVQFPYGKGFTGTTWTDSALSNSSTITLTVVAAAGNTLTANFKFLDVNGDNTDTGDVVLTGNGTYTTTVTGLYPDYFSVTLKGASAVTSSNITLASDGTTTTIATSTKPFSITTTAKYLASLNTAGTGYSNFAGSYYWNFHTGKYATVTKMSAVWDDVRTIDEVEFPNRGIPIEYMGTVAEKNSCSSSKGLCHATLQMIDLAASGQIKEQRAGPSGNQPYYSHGMNLSTDAEQICGTCHALLFAEGTTAHFGVQCYDCHASHPMPAGAE
ncbi:MAG: hypothetical protein HYY22_04400 [Thaumarchaeota archaeon]|nr:hypothetical protein [Nitrososphaerota archaeon]